MLYTMAKHLKLSTQIIPGDGKGGLFRQVGKLSPIRNARLGSEMVIF